ncbi:MAG: alpha/beta fold hydrolase [Acidimicrobiia bacterium]
MGNADDASTKGGSNDPSVVLVHGWGGSFAATWRSSGFTELLADAGRTVIGVDLLGHGDAPKPHDPEAYADLGGRILDALPDHPVDGVGFSLGALTLLRAAIEHPGRFSSLVLAGIGRNAVEPGDTTSHARLIAALEGRSDGSGDDNLARLFVQYADQPGNDRTALTAVMKRPRAPFTDHELAQVTVPVLVVIGDQDFAGPGEPLSERLPNARLVTLRNCDHFATTENFGFFDATLDFLGATPT